MDIVDLTSNFYAQAYNETRDEVIREVYIVENMTFFQWLLTYLPIEGEIL